MTTDDLTIKIKIRLLEAFILQGTSVVGIFLLLILPSPQLNLLGVLFRFLPLALCLQLAKLGCFAIII